MLSLSAADRDWLQGKWERLIESAAGERTAARMVWVDLLRHYSEPHRAYHNLTHIAFLLRHADAFRLQIASLPTVEFAIWFHDVVYDTRAKDNEHRSAVWARAAMHAMGIDRVLIGAVEKCILATQRHDAIPGVPDLPLFLDLDLAILGSPHDVYRQYAQAIRLEYDWVADADYRPGRRRVLERFAHREKLFFTAAAAACFEQQARHNLEWELHDLSISESRYDQ